MSEHFVPNTGISGSITFENAPGPDIDDFDADFIFKIFTAFDTNTEGNRFPELPNVGELRQAPTNAVSEEFVFFYCGSAVLQIPLHLARDLLKNYSVHNQVVEGGPMFHHLHLPDNGLNIYHHHEVAVQHPVPEHQHPLQHPLQLQHQHQHQHQHQQQHQHQHQHQHPLQQEDYIQDLITNFDDESFDLAVSVAAAAQGVAQDAALAAHPGYAHHDGIPNNEAPSGSMPVQTATTKKRKAPTNRNGVNKKAKTALSTVAGTARAKKDKPTETLPYTKIAHLFQGGNLNHTSLLQVMQSEFPDRIDAWKRELFLNGVDGNPHPDRQAFVQQMCFHREANHDKSFSAQRINLFFWLLCMLDFWETEDGKKQMEVCAKAFRLAFGSTIVRALQEDAKLDILADVERFYACLSYMLTQGVNDKTMGLCFLLLVGSCMAARHVYYSRGGSNMPLANLCYRYLIEVVMQRVNHRLVAEPDSACREILKVLYLLEDDTIYDTDDADDAAAAY